VLPTVKQQYSKYYEFYMLELFRNLSEDKANTYGIVLSSSGISYHVKKERKRWSIWVNEADYERALNTIEKYIEEKSLAKEYKLNRPSLYVEPIELTEEEIDEAERPKMQKLSVKERQKNFKEVELSLTEEMAIKEARRCLRCELETEDGKKAIGRQKLLI